MSFAKAIAANFRDLLLTCGVWPPLKAHNREVLEETVFPYLLQQEDLQRILFVGCQWYTWHYNQVFAEKEFLTIDIDPRKRRYGSKQHVVGSAQQLSEHYEAGSLDCVLLIGVFGWGVNDRDAAERTLGQIHRVLRSGGKLLVGWDNDPDICSFQPTELNTLQRFNPWLFPPLDASEFECEGELRHTLNFYQAT